MSSVVGSRMSWSGQGAESHELRRGLHRTPRCLAGFVGSCDDEEAQAHAAQPDAAGRSAALEFRKLLFQLQHRGEEVAVLL